MSPHLKSGGWDSHVHVFDASHAISKGHYQPEDWTLSNLMALGAPWGISHFVLVQPSVYGSDNRVMLDALRNTDGRHRGVAVIDKDTTFEQLAEMHEAGVRGIRFNLVSPVGNDSSLLTTVAPWLHQLGWHVQWYAHASHLPQILRSHLETGLPCVLDHMGGMSVDRMHEAHTWEYLRKLAQQGAWIKLSGWYRLNDNSDDFSDSRPNIQKMLKLFGERAIWGSDSPNTFFARSKMPPYRALLEAIEGFADHPMESLLTAARKLYW